MSSWEEIFLIETGLCIQNLTFFFVCFNYRTVPVIFRWIRYVSWMAYSTEALMILQLDGVDYIGLYFFMWKIRSPIYGECEVRNKKLKIINLG